MEKYSFNFNEELARKLRDAVNEKQKLSIEKTSEIDKGKEKFTYLAWNRICAIMDRLEDTIRYLNTIELGNKEENRSAFDFYGFVSYAAVAIDCIRDMGNIFNIDPNIVKKLEYTQEVFGDKYGEKGTDKKFFEYIRSLCVMHPTYTNRQKEYLKGCNFHCCPFVTWSHIFGMRADGDLVATVYTSKRGDNIINIPLYIKEFELYIEKWINHIENVIDAIHKYSEEVYDELRKTPIKNLSDFSGNVEEYILHLKDEYGKRFGSYNSYVFDEYIRIFKIKLTNEENQGYLEKYKNAIIYSLDFLHNALQNMSFDDSTNTGIYFPDSNLSTDLFMELSSIFNYNGSFSGCSYEFEKIYYLEPDSPYSYFDKIYARNLLDKLKDTINKFVVFDNQESDEEVCVLIKLARYLDALNSKCLLNRNIPNEEKYRVKVLSDDEWKELFTEENTTENEGINIAELLKKYGK